MMTVQSYARLSAVYDEGWGGFAGRYVELIQRLLTRCGIITARILDLACGTGELALALADIGHGVVGVDLSPEMIDVARAKVGERTDICLIVQDMTQLSLDGRFDLVSCTFDSLNYLTDPADVRATFQRVAEVLHSEGLFVFDINTHRLYENRHKGIYQQEASGSVIWQRLSYDSEAHIAKTVFTFSDGIEEIHWQRSYEREEIRAFLSEAGMCVVHEYSRLDGTPFDSDSERLICVAQLHHPITKTNLEGKWSNSPEY